MHATTSGSRFAALPLLSVCLAVVLLFQVCMPTPRSEFTLSASWANLATTVDEAKRLSKVIVLGHVERVDSANDIVVPAEGEPGDIDRVGAEVVTIGVDKTYKGSVASGSIQLFHTKVDTRGAELDPRPASSPGKKTRVPLVSDLSRSVLLDGDPPYQFGEEYVLFLTDGPKLSLSGVSIHTSAVIAPEGRYLLVKTGDELRLRAMTTRGFAPLYDGQPVDKLADTIAQSKHRGHNSTAGIIAAAVAGGLIIGLTRPSGNASAGGSTTTTNAQSRASYRPEITSVALYPPTNLTPGERIPANLEAQGSRGSTVTLAWSSLSSADHYRVELYPPKGSYRPRTVTGSSTISFTPSLVGLYRWRVLQVGASGAESPFSEFRYFRISP